jgi:hypothetical protein
MSRNPALYKLVVKFFHDTGTGKNNRKDAHLYPIGLRHFKNCPLHKCYKLINERWAGKVAYAAIYDQKEARGQLIARFTADNGWNHLV